MTNRLGDTTRHLLQSRALPMIATALTVGIVAVVAAAVLVTEQRAYSERVTAEVVREGGRMRADLERAVDVRISRTEGLVGFATAAASNGGIDEERFAQYAAHAAEDTDVELRSFQLAPDAVVTHIYPLAGNEEAIGHDLMADPERRAAVEATIAARRVMVAGPFELLQGGTAIVARAPVFIPTADGGERWWGLATVVADIEPLFEEAALKGDSYEVAIRGTNGLGADGEVFYGDPSVFDGQPELFDITLPAGSWQLGLVPAGGWDTVVWPTGTRTVGGFALLAALLGALVWRVVTARVREGQLVNDRAELISTANVPIVQVTADGRILVWNEEAERLTGLLATTVVGTLLSDAAVPADGLRAVIDELRAATVASRERVAGHIAQVHRRDGQALQLVFNTSPVVDRTGAVTGVVVIGQDVTARADAERIRAEHEALAEAARLKDEFLATVSHELRTPLNGILGLTTLLRDGTAGELNATQQTYVNHAHDAGDHLLRLINDVLDMTRLDSLADSEEEHVAVHVAAAVEQAVRMVVPDATHRDVVVTTEPSSSTPAVLADQRRLVQVLLNLLSNAVKFTDAGGKVSIATSVHGDEVHVAVADTGIGIAQEQMERLFQPFQQLDARLDRAYEGTGLGLALARRLAERFGGRIDVQSTLGEGSVFTLVMPLLLTATGDDEPLITAPVPTPDIDEDARRPVVLIAEDNEVNRLIATEFLNVLGYEGATATNGEEAVELTRTLRPDIVLMDIQMPRMDGLEATRVLKADPQTASIPIVALTAMAMNGDEERCRAAGCDDYLPKPIELNELGRILAAQLAASAGHRP